MKLSLALLYIILSSKLPAIGDHERQFINDFIQDNQVIFDVGGNIGEFSDYIEMKKPHSEIYQFEPEKCCFQRLKNKQKNKPNVHLFEIALSNSKSQKTFFNNDGSGLSGLYFRENVHLKDNQYSVSTDTIDNFCSEHGIEKIHFLKIDTEGSELDILKGAAQMLTEKRIDFIQFEYGGTYREAKITLRQVYTYLKRKGYKVGYYPKYRDNLNCEPSFRILRSWNPRHENYILFDYHAFRPGLI